MFSKWILPVWRTFTGYFSRRQFYEPGGYAEIWHIAWPLIILSASNTVMMITNRVFLAWDSKDEVAASMPASQMFFTLMAFFLITTSFTATIVAQHHGSDNREGCIRATWNGFYFGAIVAAILAYLLPVGGAWILTHNGHHPQIAAYEAEYFVAISPCAGLICMETPFLSFFTGRGKTRIVACIKILGCLISIPLHYIFVFGKLGLPPMGILGAGFASTIASLCSLCISASCLLLVNEKGYETRRHKRFHMEYIRKLLCFGTPAGFQTFLRNAAFACVIIMIGRLGNEELAATSIALSINMIGNMPMIGLMDATSIITGQYIGKRRLLVAERIAGRSLRILFVWMISISVIYLVYPQLLIHIFDSQNQGTTQMDNARITEYVILILRLAVIFNLLDATRFIAMGSLRGAGDTFVPLLIGLATSWLIQIPGTVYLVYVAHASIGSVWLFITIYIAIDAFFMLWRRRSGAWKKIRVIDLPPPPPEEEEEEARLAAGA